MIFTYSTKGSRPQDAKAIQAFKEHCARKNINASGVIVELVKKWHQGELANAKQ